MSGAGEPEGRQERSCPMGVKDVLAELQKSRNAAAASPGQVVQRRHLSQLSQHGLRLLKQTSEQVVWQDGCFSLTAETKWDHTRCGRDIVLSNNNTTVTRSNGNEWGGVLGARVFREGTHSFSFVINKCQTDYVYVGVAYENVDYNDNYNARNIVLRAGDGSLRVFSSSQGCFGGYRSGDTIRIEVDMTDKLVTFFKNDVRLCQAAGLTAPVRPFVSIGSRDVVISISAVEQASASEDAEVVARSAMLDIAVRTGLELVFAMLVKEDNTLIRRRLLRSAHAALLALPPLAFFCDSVGLKQEAFEAISSFLQSLSLPCSPGAASAGAAAAGGKVGASGGMDKEENEERMMIVLVLLELAVARGSLSFTLTVLLHVHEMGIPLDARALPTVQRFAALDAVADTKVRSYFSDSLRVDAASAAEVAGGGVDAGVELASDDAMKDTDTMPGRRTVPEAGAGAEVGPSSERDSAGGGPGGEGGRLAGWGEGRRGAEAKSCDGSDGSRCQGARAGWGRELLGGLEKKEVYAAAQEALERGGMVTGREANGLPHTRAVLDAGASTAKALSLLILAQVEAASRRLKYTASGAVAPCCIEPSVQALEQLHSLLCRHMSHDTNAEVLDSAVASRNYHHIHRYVYISYIYV